MTEQTRGKRLAKYVPDYVVFDLETTGISVATDKIIEISAIKVKNRQIIDQFSTLVHPGCRIPPGATAVNGITDDMIADAPEIALALPEFLEFAETYVLVGHNIHSFDLNFINRAAEELCGIGIKNDYIDTLYMARTCLPQLKHHRLTDLADYFRISTEGAHRAMNDCIMNQKCFEELAKIQETISVVLCPKCGGEMKRRSGKFGSFFGCSNYPQCRYTKNEIA